MVDFARLNRERKWDKRYLELAATVGGWSKDPSTKVGAVLVRPNNSVASLGFNGFPPGHDDSPELYADRAYKYKHVIHAERNALNFLGPGQRADGFTLYTSFPCCAECVLAAGRMGVQRIVNPPLPTDDRDLAWIQGWHQQIENAEREARVWGIKLVVVRV